jgi:hypothetical protein
MTEMEQKELPSIASKLKSKTREIKQKIGALAEKSRE